MTRKSISPTCRFVAISILMFTSQFVLGQACGIYRIEYRGSLVSAQKEVVQVHLPSTWFLSGVVKAKSEIAFVNVDQVDSVFNVEICSELTSPYTDVQRLLALYKAHSDYFTMKVSYLENEKLTEFTVLLDWSEIDVEFVDEGNLGSLFIFTLGIIEVP